MGYSRAVVSFEAGGYSGLMALAMAESLNMASEPNHPYGEVCLAVFKPDAFLLKRQLESIAFQSLAHWRCHIGIDGEDPATASTVVSAVGHDSRFVIHHFADNVGFYRNFERIIAQVGTEAHWVALADQDDYWYPEKLHRLVSSLERTGAMAAVGQARVVDRAGSFMGTTTRRETRLLGLLFDNQVTGSMTVFRRTILASALPFPDPTDAAYHDHWLGVTAKTLGRIVFLDDPVQDYVQHDANVLGEERGRRVTGRIQALRERSSRSGAGKLRYLAVHRWGWRVRMARSLLQRAADQSESDQLVPIARGSLTPLVVFRLATAALRGDMAVGRGIGLLAGAFGWSVLRLDDAETTAQRD